MIVVPHAPRGSTAWTVGTPVPVWMGQTVTRWGGCATVPQGTLELSVRMVRLMGNLPASSLGLKNYVWIKSKLFYWNGLSGNNLRKRALVECGTILILFIVNRNYILLFSYTFILQRIYFYIITVGKLHIRQVRVIFPLLIQFKLHASLHCHWFHYTFL